MYMMFEIRRILKPDGVLVLTTPNISSLRSIAAVLEGGHPGLYTCYKRPGLNAEYEPRHAREYTPGEVCQLITEAGCQMSSVETFTYGQDNPESLRWVEKLRSEITLPNALQGACISATARKSSNSQIRFPAWLYDG
jgi:hypothetical protein